VLTRAIDRAALINAALRLFEAGDYAACRGVVEALLLFGMPDVPVLLAYAVSLAETDDPDGASAVFEQARTEMGCVPPGLVRTKLEGVFERIAERLPGGRFHKLRREQLAASAGRLIPKLSKAG
jgi:hypothetical protein